VKDVLVGTAGEVADRVIVDTAGLANVWWERARSARLVGRSWKCISWGRAEVYGWMLREFYICCC
jgi:hypothetical protein